MRRDDAHGLGDLGDAGDGVLVDDAHGIGTMGKTGAGTGQHFGVQDDIDVYFATFAKSFAGIGGFVAGDKDVISYLRFNLRSQIYAKSLPMAMTIKSCTLPL